MLTGMERHTLLNLTQEGREEALARREPAQEKTLACWSRYPYIPAIFTGQMDSESPDLLRVGFSFPERIGNSRCRIASRLSLSAVDSIVTPWMAAELGSGLDSPMGALLHQIRAAADRSAVKLGLFGAVSLQIATGLPYLHNKSDIDIVICTPSASALCDFWAALKELELRSGIRIDAELRVNGIQHVKCRELFSSQCTVLVKGGVAPQLLSRQAIWESLEAG